jgi:hypothetical protein
MQTERVTFLTSRDHKAALDAYAASNGQSVGHVVREASSHWIAQPTIVRAKSEDEEALEFVVPLLEELLPKWNAQIDSMEHSIDRARKAINDVLAGDPA